jgi:hypothetical protein
MVLFLERYAGFWVTRRSGDVSLLTCAPRKQKRPLFYIASRIFTGSQFIRRAEKVELLSSSERDN